MPVYVDALIDYGWMLGPSCHLIADTEEELHEFAKKVGMKRSWFQNEGGKLPHYDLVKSRRDKAIELGAIILSRRELVDRIREHRSKQTPTIPTTDKSE